MSATIENLLEQSKDPPMKPVKRSELLGGRRPSLDQLEFEDEKALLAEERAEQRASQR